MALTVPTDTEVGSIKKLDDDLQRVLQDYRVSYVLRAALADKGYTLMGDLSRSST